VRPTFGSTYELRASAAGRGITFSVDAATTHQACALSGATTVVFDHAGTCVIAADVSAKAATHVTQSIDVPQADQTVRISSAVPGNPVVAGATYAVTAVAGASGNPVTFTASGACTVSGGDVSFVHADACTVTAHEGGDTDYTAATDTQTFQVGQGAQTVVFTSTPPASARVGDTYPVAATSTSGADVSFSTTSAACTVSGATVSFAAPGACVIDADQAGTPDYAAAPRVSQTVSVSDEVDAVMSVTAAVDALHGQGQQQVTATVAGLPAGSAATLTATVDSNAHIVARGNACTETAATGGGQTFVCTVGADPQQFVFDATVNRGRPVMSFTLTPTPPLVLATGSTPNAQVTLGGAAQAAVAPRTFTRRTQN
jgi:hypothetical protein